MRDTHLDCYLLKMLFKITKIFQNHNFLTGIRVCSKHLHIHVKLFHQQLHKGIGTFKRINCILYFRMFYFRNNLHLIVWQSMHFIKSFLSVYNLQLITSWHVFVSEKSLAAASWPKQKNFIQKQLQLFISQQFIFKTVNASIQNAMNHSQVDLIYFLNSQSDILFPD